MTVEEFEFLQQAQRTGHMLTGSWITWHRVLRRTLEPEEPVASDTLSHVGGRRDDAHRTLHFRSGCRHTARSSTSSQESIDNPLGLRTRNVASRLVVTDHAERLAELAAALPESTRWPIRCADQLGRKRCPSRSTHPMLDLLTFRGRISKPMGVHRLPRVRRSFGFCSSRLSAAPTQRCLIILARWSASEAQEIVPLPVTLPLLQGPAR